MTTASNSVGIGPWSFDAGPFAIILLVVIMSAATGDCPETAR